MDFSPARIRNILPVISPEKKTYTFSTPRPTRRNGNLKADGKWTFKRYVMNDPHALQMDSTATYPQCQQNKRLDKFLFSNRNRARSRREMKQVLFVSSRQFLLYPNVYQTLD